VRRRAQGKVASPVVYAIARWEYLSQGFEIERRSPNATLVEPGSPAN